MRIKIFANDVGESDNEPVSEILPIDNIFHI